MDGSTSRVLRELDMRDFNSHDEVLRGMGHGVS